MKRLLIIALAAIAMNLHAQDNLPDSRPKSRYLEISIDELPPGSEKDLDAAVRDYSRNAREDGARLSHDNNVSRKSTAAALITYPKEHVYEVDNAAMFYRPNPQTSLGDHASVMIKPADIAVTQNCTLLGSDTNGVYSRKRKQYSGYSRYFKCPDGDVYARDMTFFGMRKVVIKEQNNILIAGVSGQMYGYKDKRGNSYTLLNWVSNDIDHAVQKAGTDASTRRWLMQYAEELIAKEAK